MTVLLVLFTLIILLAVDYFVQRKKQRALGTAVLSMKPLFPQSAWQFPAELALAPNHLWLRREKNNTVTVGIDNFLLGLTGGVERIDLPAEGAIVGRGERPVVLRDRSKKLELDAPVEGQVVAVNKRVRRAPHTAAENPYTDGWLFTMVPSDEGATWSSFLRGESAVAWLKKQNDIVKEFLLARVPQLEFATMQDGGVPANGILKDFNDDVWEEFQRTFLTTEPKLKGEYDHA